jgi:four helix bundle protein
VFKSGASIGANHREVLKASLKKHFPSSIRIVVREADETLYWLELPAESNTIKPTLLANLIQECGELPAIFSATQQTARTKRT